jgi:predicted O-linked N-acetylglucosamine transferase (SPINDLY family)
MDAPAIATLLEDGVRLQRQGALADAAARYSEILKREPANADALYRLAQVACQEGSFAAGIDLVRRALAADPRRARAHLLLGMALARLGRVDEALASFDQAIACDPGLADAHGNRGDVLAALGRQGEAVESYDRALAIAPDQFETWCNRGAALHDLRRYDEALASCDRAIALKPDVAEVYFNRGNALTLLGRHAEALASYDRALALDPAYLDALHARGAVLPRLKRHNEAAGCYERMLALDPDHPRALGELASCYLTTCDWPGLERIKPALDRRLADGTLIISPFVLIGLPVGTALLSECTARFVAKDIPRRAPLVSGRSVADRGRIRVAYLSADFRGHATAYLMAGLFKRHDRKRFEIIGVSFGADDGSDIRARLAGSFDEFLDVSARSDRDVAELLHARRVDIAVDLKGHTEAGRPGIMAYRPAPIQATYLGYPGPLALDFIDYVIGDKVILPFDRQPFYGEKIVHLPGSYQVNDSQRVIAARRPTRAELGLPDDGFVFCCFNHSWKITPEMFDIWMRLLRAVDGSVLWLFQANDPACANLRREAQARGIDPARLIFAPFRGPAEHLARIACANLFLDTLPCNAHTTASDALWAGVPVLTCMGETFAGRVAASLLHAVGLPELMTDSLPAYEALARKLATDRALLPSLRRKLAGNRQGCALFDTARFTRHLESAYTTMWGIARRGEGPRSFTVDPIDP